jgi:hypothetical protein
MKNLVIVLVVLVVGIVGLGFYQGWFQLSTDNTDHKSKVTFTVDQDKIQEDEAKAKEKVHGLGHQAKERTSDRTDKAEEQERRP